MAIGSTREMEDQEVLEKLEMPVGNSTQLMVIKLSG